MELNGTHGSRALWLAECPLFLALGLPRLWSFQTEVCSALWCTCHVHPTSRVVSRWNKQFPGVPLFLFRGHWKTISLSCLLDMDCVCLWQARCQGCCCFNLTVCYRHSPTSAFVSSCRAFHRMDAPQFIEPTRCWFLILLFWLNE